MNFFLLRRFWNHGVSRLFVSVGFLSLLLAGEPLLSRNAEAFEAIAEEVVDGDTIRLSDGEAVRYLGIDAPELRKKIGGRWVYAPEPFAEEATELNKKLVEGKKIRLEVDRAERKDRYGRLLAYVFIGDVFVNKRLLEKGLAKLYLFRPHRKYRRVLRRAEEEAIGRRRGVWSQ